METIKVISTDKATVVIQVNPQVEQDSVIFIDGQRAKGTSHNPALKEFFKAQPKALGIVQIMIGVMIFFLGVLLTINANNRHPAILVYSGITYWGSIIYISAGFLSVAAQNKLHLCVVKASLGMNAFSAITAGFAFFLMSIQLRVMMYQSLHAESLRIVWILLAFTIPQFIISIFISGFACKATCNTNSTVVNVALNQV